MIEVTWQGETLEFEDLKAFEAWRRIVESVAPPKGYFQNLFQAFYPLSTLRDEMLKQDYLLNKIEKGTIWSSSPIHVPIKFIS